LILALLACVGGGPDDSGEPPGTDPVDVDDLAGEAACGETIFLAFGDEVDVAIEVPLPLLDAASAGEVATGTFAVGEAGVRVVAQRQLDVGDACGSAEDFPPTGDDAWEATGGMLTVTYTPHQAWGGYGEWVYDGTVTGEVETAVEGLELTPTGAEIDVLYLDAATWTAAHSRLELPA
jgi:hypothetical protein